MTKKICSTFFRLCYGIFYKDPAKNEFKWTTVVSENNPAQCPICQKGIGKYFLRGNYIFHFTQSLDFFVSF
jgi:hypothetical protein